MTNFNKLLYCIAIALFTTFSVEQAQSQITSYPYTEDFGSSGCGLPTGYSNSGSDPWDFQNSSETYMEGLDHTSSGGCFASMDDSGGSSDDSCLLTSPVFDLTAFPKARLSFWWQNSNSTSSLPHTAGPRPWSNLYVDVSTDSGMTWTRDVWQVEDSQQIGWAEGLLELGAYVSNKTVLRFRGLETQSFRSDLSLDDIHIFKPIDSDAGVTAIVGLTAQCPGSIPVSATIQNFGSDTLTTAVVNWSINGVTQTPVNFSGSLAPLESTTVSLGNLTSTSTGTYDVVSWTTSPNSDTDSIAANDTAKVFGYEAAMTGTFTVGVAGDFLTIADLADALTSKGVCGAVIANVDSATYMGKATFGPIMGTSSTNTITINGNGATISDNTTSTDRHIVRLNSASYMTIDNLNIVGTGVTYGYGIHLTNGSDHNTISNCSIDLSAVTSTSSTNSTGILASGSTTSTSTAGNNANYCTFSNNTIMGGASGLYYGIRINGNSGGLDCVGNSIIDNIITDAYAYQIYLDDTDSSHVARNDVSRAGKTSVTTFYGIFLTAGNRNALIERNVIHNTHDAATSLTGSSYGIYFSGSDAPVGSPNIAQNNLMYDFNSNGTVYAIYNSSSDGAEYYHNTISLDHTAATGGTTRGFYQTSSASDIIFQNNIISITRGGTGTKHGVYFNTNTSTITSDYNDIYVNSQGSGTQSIGRWDGTDHSTMSSWRTANSGAFDQNSDSLSPDFTNIATDEYTPQSFTINNAGTPIAGITDDLFGNARSLTAPDMGAIEFTAAPPNDSCSNAMPVVAGTTAWTTVGSTNDSIIACGTSIDSAGGVWFSYLGNGSFVHASLCNGTSFDSKLSIYQGDCDSLVCVTGNNDSCNTQSTVGWCSVDSIEYLIFVHGNGSAQGAFELEITETPVVIPTISFSPDSVVCDGETVTLTSDSAVSYLWDDSSTAITRMVTATGSYTVTTTDTNGCAATSDAQDITVNPLPLVNLGPDTTICENESITLDAGNAGNYSWSTGESTQSITYQGTSGSTTISVTVTDGNGCENMDEISITVDICAGIAENGLGSLVSIYPNPNDGTFFIDLQDVPSGIATVNILDLKGQVVYNDRLESGTANRSMIELTDLNKGMYLIRINVANDWFTGKLIIE